MLVIPDANDGYCEPVTVRPANRHVSGRLATCEVDSQTKAQETSACAQTISLSLIGLPDSRFEIVGI